MDETVAWLRERPYYAGQIRTHEVLAGEEANSADLEVDDRLESSLADRGIERLYGHQADAVEAVRAGEDAVIATATASGKSLAYTVPAFERAMDRRATTLYLAPQVALINDQTETLSELAGEMGFASGVDVAQYTGRQSRSEKEAVRDRQPTVLLCTPDMLHYALLPHARRLWTWFFERLETVVVDEVHEYRGVFGSHVALVFRRLARLCEEFGADPEFVCCSATIGNPVEHAATVTGRDPNTIRLVDTDESESGPTHWLFWNPPEYGGDGWGIGRRKSSHTETERLFCDLVAEGYQTLVFTGARQTAERYASESAKTLRERGEHDLADGVVAYQAALTNDRRREIERGLHSGDVRGVWSTNALELGVDIGGLDAVLLDGYPGTRMDAHQQAGRAGRGTDPSLVVLVGFDVGRDIVRGAIRSLVRLRTLWRFLVRREVLCRIRDAFGRGELDYLRASYSPSSSSSSSAAQSSAACARAALKSSFIHSYISAALASDGGRSSSLMFSTCIYAFNRFIFFSSLSVA